MVINYDQLYDAAENEVRLQLREAQSASDRTVVLMRYSAADSVVRVCAALAKADPRWVGGSSHLVDLVTDIRLLMSGSDAVLALEETQKGRGDKR